MDLRKFLAGAVYASVLATSVTPATAVTIDYSNIAGSNISLDPTNGCGAVGSVGCFQFTPNGPSDDNMEITSGSASGLLGRIEGLFGVGTISTPFPGLQTATVSGAGTLNIFDGVFTLTADLSWLSISQFGVGSSLNTEGSANLSNISYSGTNADLLALRNGGTGIQTATFQFTTPISLTSLFSASTTTVTSFSGSITPIPVPAAVWLFGTGLVGLIAIARRRS